MTKKITIGIKEPGQSWHFSEVEDTLNTYQRIVGGYIEGFYTNYLGLHFFCNEEGKFMNLKPNLIAGGEVIVGTVFCVRSDDEGAFTSVTGEDIAVLSEAGD